MIKMNFTSNQVAFEYAVYMIVGSYFRKTHCTHFLQEKKMRVQYCEQKLENQYRMEETCIRYAETFLLPEIPVNFWNNDVTVRFVVYHDSQMGNQKTEIQFISKESILCIRGTYRRGKSELIHEYKYKKSVDEYPMV